MVNVEFSTLNMHDSQKMSQPNFAFSTSTLKHTPDCIFSLRQLRSNYWYGYWNYKYGPGHANIFMGYLEEEFLDSCELRPWVVEVYLGI
jgi:hypothetical protein